MALTCPSPEPADCGVYSARAVYSSAELLRRALLRERRQYVGLRQLVRAEAALRPDHPPPAPPARPPTLTALPAPTSVPAPVFPVNRNTKGSP